MATRLISPPRDDWDSLPTPLTSGERQVAEFFDRHLPEGWEIYVQPHLNGLQPDFVLLHPDIGIAVYEVKDWNPSASSYWTEEIEDVKGRKSALMAQYPGTRKAVVLDGNRNPFLRARDYKNYIHQISTAALPGRVGRNRITSGVIFTVGDSRYWESLGRRFSRPNELAQHYPIVGEDALGSGRLDKIFMEAVCPQLGLMTDQVADYLRGWLREPDFVRQQRQPLPIPSDVQRRLVDSGPGVTGLRRIKGPAGSGKSFVLADRAARLAYEGKRVLVVGFNITLSNYLRDLAVRHLRGLAVNNDEYRASYRRIIFTHFHEWKSWGNKYEEGNKFDAILVDEGNDFSLQWWHEMCRALKDEGEMMLAFDQTQDIYLRAGAWTEDNMRGAGFRGRWNELEGSYRFHGDLLPALRYFADKFMSGIEVDLPIPVQSEFSPVASRWVQVEQNSDWISVCLEELKSLQSKLPQDSGYSDIVCLLPEHLDGFQFVQVVKEQLGIQVSHIFSGANNRDLRQEESRPLKRAFWGGNGQLKATTIHSFKGWEARHLLIYIDDIEKTKTMPTLFYVALTRLVRHLGGSLLTVVSSCPELREFGQQFFDDFVEIDDMPF